MRTFYHSKVALGVNLALHGGEIVPQWYLNAFKTH